MNRRWPGISKARLFDGANAVTDDAGEEDKQRLDVPH
jgi:hypothetical protein